MKGNIRTYAWTTCKFNYNGKEWLVFHDRLEANEKIRKI